MTAQATATGGGISFGGLLAILFIALKLTGYIDWSWWWVLAPLWAPVAILLVAFAVTMFIVVIASQWKYLR